MSDEPLVGLDLEALRAEADKAGAFEAEHGEEHKLLEYENRPWYIILYHIGLAFANCATVSGAYFFLIAAGLEITPRCYRYHDYSESSLFPSSPDSETWNEWLCNVTTICFWTYPLVCPLVLVFVFFKNLLEARLYYECLINRMMLDYKSYSYVYSGSFWFLILYGLVGLSCLFYIKSASSWADKSYRELVYGLLAYIAPLFAFLYILCSKWSMEWHLIPLAKYCEKDHKKAIQHLDASVFITEKDFKNAWEAAEDLLEHAEGRSGDKIVLNSPEFFFLIRQQYEKKKLGPLPGCCDCFRSFWVLRLLMFSSHFNDSRAKNFRCWVYWYFFFVFLAVLAFIWSVIHTGHYLLIFEKVLRNPVPLGVSPHDIVPQGLRDFN